MIISLISWLIFGLIAGGIARLLMPGEQPMGCFMTSILGIIGSYVGGTVWFFTFRTEGGEWLQPSGWILSILGAVIVLAIAGAASRKSK